MSTLDILLKRHLDSIAIRDIHLELVPPIAFEGVKLSEILSCPLGNGFPSHTPETLAATVAMMEGSTQPNLSELGIFNRVQCQVLNATWSYFQSLKHTKYYKYLDRPLSEISPFHLEEMSFLTDKASIALSFKIAWLWILPDNYYFGFPPATSPVKNFFKLVFGMTNPSKGTVIEKTFAIARDLDEDPLNINTAMWIVGL